MGMFDEMVINCPCGGRAVRQFKDLACNLDEYNISTGAVECYYDVAGKIPEKLEDLETWRLLILLAVKFHNPDFDPPCDGVDNFFCESCKETIRVQMPELLRSTVLSWLRENR